MMSNSVSAQIFLTLWTLAPPFVHVLENITFCSLFTNRLRPFRVLFHRWTQRCVERIGNAHCVTDVWTHIESRQFIGWWCDAVSDAITSSAHTGERAIHSSDFSAFTKRSHHPSLLRFSGPITAYSDAIHSFALRRLPTVELCSPRGEVP